MRLQSSVGELIDFLVDWESPAGLDAGDLAMSLTSSLADAGLISSKDSVMAHHFIADLKLAEHSFPAFRKPLDRSEDPSPRFAPNRDMQGRRSLKQEAIFG